MDLSNKNIATKKPLLIMGIGNMLMGDEGVGVHFIKNIPPSVYPPEIDIVDGGTGGFHLMPFFEKYEKVILVDATLDKNKAGEIRLIKPRFSTDFPRAMSTHDIGLKDVVEGMLLLGTMPEIYLFTVSIDEVQPMRVGLSPKIENCLKHLQNKISALADKLMQNASLPTY